MKTRRARHVLLPGVLAAAFALGAAAVPGCAWREGTPWEEFRPAAPVDVSAPAPGPPAPPAPAPVPSPPPKPPAAVPAPPAPSPADAAAAAGAAALQEGNPERALELFLSALKEKPGHPDALKGFDDALAALKKSGDAAYDQGKAEEAGKRWTGTLRYMGHPAAKGRTHRFTRAEVKGQVDRLTAAQMEKGLLNYRKGDIPAAIAAWKTILAYDPENEEAARSIRTASTQLENLLKIAPAN